MWRDDPSTTMVIGWHQVSGNEPKLYYDIIDHGKNFIAYQYSQSADHVIDAKGMRNHFVRLKNLLPNTTYYFIIVDSEGLNKRLSFKTMPDDPETRLSIVAGGDSRNNRKSRKNANILVSKLRPDCVLFAGDMTGGDTAGEWKAWMDDWQSTITEEGRLIPIIVARGNHEFSNRSLIELFDVKEKELYYGFTFGGNLLRVFTLNSLISVGGEQRNWLRQDLKNHQHIRWKFAQYHFPIRPHTARKSERNEQLKHWANLFYHYKVNVAIECDAHVVKTTYPIRPSNEKGSDMGFIRDDVGGTIYVGEGCWGAPLRRNNDNKKWTRASGSFNQFKWIFVDKYNLEIRTVKTNNAVMVDALTETNRFDLPRNISIWEPPTGDVIVVNSKEKEEEVLQFVKAPKKPSFMLPQSVLTVADETTTIPQPLQVFDYIAVPKAKDVTVKWSAKNEPSGLVFDVERASNDEDFRTIARINALTDSPNGDTNFYEFSDKNIAFFAEKVFYRLKKVLPNGSTQIYKTIGLKNKQWEEQQPLIPDEEGQVKVRYKLKEPTIVVFTIHNDTQKKVLSNKTNQQAKGNYLKSFNFKDFPAGRYLLTIQIGNTISRELILKH